jgi:hypothetical protein
MLLKDKLYLFVRTLCGTEKVNEGCGVGVGGMLSTQNIA